MGRIIKKKLSDYFDKEELVLIMWVIKIFNGKVVKVVIDGEEI